MSSVTKTFSNSDYLQPNSSPTNESKQSPLELLALTCSNIGKDCTLPSTTDSIKMSHDMSRSLSSVNLFNSDKPFISTKNSSPSQTHSTNRKSTPSSKSRTKSLSSSSTINSKYSTNSLSQSIDPWKSNSESLHRSSLPSYITREYSDSSICNLVECSQCETYRYNLSSFPMYSCECQICSAKFYSDHQLIDHIQYSHRPPKISHYYRFRPYFKPSHWINANDQVPFFYPHLSLTPSMNQIIQYLNIDRDDQ